MRGIVRPADGGNARNLPTIRRGCVMGAMTVQDLDPELGLPRHQGYDPDLEVDLELVSPDLGDDLSDPWFELGDSEPVLAAGDAEVFEIDPVHPLRRLGSWVRRVGGRAA